ncbi:hypothetical protein [Curtobacterium sp. SORGH_AS_0776]|uniref:hypothetical protein n=1 Tax=Curtobacterium sp. SORGH_AS_0776 TaxID=3041798 RepID=UPI00285FA8B3|nr:hypothetical protein [Curtobacterium sp. SORGH_AS_0776]MDR6172221.1 hypothetical protein [Curtobacterium sp. SORGH_AS_0776]
MTVVMTVGELLDAFRPVAEQMLRRDEFRAAEFWVYSDWSERLRRVVDTEVADEGMALAWSVAGDDGDSWLWLRDGEPEMLLKIADDFQDFIAESAFAWGRAAPDPAAGAVGATGRRTGGAVPAGTAPPVRPVVRPRRGPS